MQNINEIVFDRANFDLSIKISGILKKFQLQSFISDTTLILVYKPLKITMVFRFLLIIYPINHNDNQGFLYLLSLYPFDFHNTYRFPHSNSYFPKLIFNP